MRTSFASVNATVPLLHAGLRSDVNALKHDLEHASLGGVVSLVRAARIETFDKACQLLFLVHVFAQRRKRQIIEQDVKSRSSLLEHPLVPVSGAVALFDL